MEQVVKIINSLFALTVILNLILSWNLEFALTQVWLAPACLADKFAIVFNAHRLTISQYI